MKGRVFNLQRFSTKDGPGIRTTAFLKGCNLHCMWCHNPESLSGHLELNYHRDNCIFCGECIASCAESALCMDGETWLLDTARCTLCGDCVKTCKTGAIGLWGKEYEADELVDILLRDKEYYEDSGGGVTFSGGEPLLQTPFLLECMPLLMDAGINIAIDTALHVKWSILEKVLPYTNLLLIDVKGINPAKHIENTGVKPDLIRKNINRLKTLPNGPKVFVRIPLIRDLNDNLEELPSLVELLSDWPDLERVELLPYHNLGVDKAKQLVSGYKQDTYQPPHEEIIRKFELELEISGLPVMKLLTSVRR